MNSLLKRQIRKHLGTHPEDSEKISTFINAVNLSYQNYEEQQKMIQRAMLISSDELFEANQKLKLKELVGVHIFRFIGSFFLILAFYDQLPRIIGLIAGIGDVVAAATSIFVVRAIKNNKSYAKRLTLIWNTFGMLDILATSATAIILTKISIDTGSQGVDFLAQFPFCFIPSFAPATIIFLHLLIYRKLLSKKFQ